MVLTQKQIEHIAELAKVRLTEEELDLMAQQLSTILDHFQALAEVDTRGVPPTVYPFPLQNVLRPDEITPPLDQKDVLGIAPELEKDYIKVPPILE